MRCLIANRLIPNQIRNEKLEIRNFSTMTSPIAYLNETYDELKKVVWPTRAEVIRLTSVVIIISVAVGVYIGGLDFLFTKLMSTILK